MLAVPLQVNGDIVNNQAALQAPNVSVVAFTLNETHLNGIFGDVCVYAKLPVHQGNLRRVSLVLSEPVIYDPVVLIDMDDFWNRVSPIRLAHTLILLHKVGCHDHQRAYELIGLEVDWCLLVLRGLTETKFYF